VPLLCGEGGKTEGEGEGEGVGALSCDILPSRKGGLLKLRMALPHYVALEAPSVPFEDYLSRDMIT